MARRYIAQEITALAIALAMGIAAAPADAQTSTQPHLATLEKLGRALFLDRNLSATRRQGCVSCHSPELAFTDPRELGPVEGAVSLGADGVSLGDRNAPTLTYVSAIPRRHISNEGHITGGLFLDGRAEHLEAQALEPFLNAREMAMPDKASVIARLRENPDYVSAFQTVFESDILSDDDRAFAAVGRALAAFQRSREFEPFDAKFDRVLAGAAEFTPEERRGYDLFFDPARTSCSGCHSSKSINHAAPETFSNARYFNLGLPANSRVRALNGLGLSHVDPGLVHKGPADEDGAFRVPTLRNVAVTAPYMHNGLIKDLPSAIEAHQRERRIAPEVQGLAPQDLVEPPSLDKDAIHAVISFLKTLTDQRYRHLLEN